MVIEAPMIRGTVRLPVPFPVTYASSISDTILSAQSEISESAIPNEMLSDIHGVDRQTIFRRHGLLFVVSAPSGTGKSTLCHNLRHTPDFIYSVSCTTRSPRPGEIDGEDYHFLSRAAFEEKIAAGELLEYAEVHGNYYGTLKETVVKALLEGTDVLLDIDAQGAASIRGNADKDVSDSLVDVFIMPPTLSELERRLRKRGTEKEDQIHRRLQAGREEMKRWREFKYTILSGSTEEDLAKFRAIMRAERYVSKRLTLHDSA